MAATARETLHLSCLTLGEIRVGIERLRPRDAVQATALEMWLLTLTPEYRDRVLPIDAAIAETWGRIRAAAGPLPITDGLIAATAKVHNLTVVTRNVRDFKRTGVPVLNPWQS